MDAFLADFDLYFAKLFDGLRHDSGDPVEWGEKALAHYEKLRIDPHTKMLTFSDSLDLPRIVCHPPGICRPGEDRVSASAPISPTISVFEPLNLVMKLVSCNGNPVAKISDAPGKTLCDNDTFLAYLQQVFDVKPGAVRGSPT